MKSSNGVLIGGLILLTVGFTRATLQNKPKTPVIAGALGVVLFASLLELAGTNATKVANALVGVAVLTALITEIPDIVTAVQNAQKGGSNVTTNSGQPTGSASTAAKHPITSGTGGPSQA